MKESIRFEVALIWLLIAGIHQQMHTIDFSKLKLKCRDFRSCYRFHVIEERLIMQDGCFSCFSS